MRAIVLLFVAMFLGLAGGFAWSKYSRPSAAQLVNANTGSAAKPGQTAEQVQESAYYADCTAVRDAGKAPLYAGQPGYRPELDAGGSGMACPPLS